MRIRHCNNIFLPWIVFVCFLTRFPSISANFLLRHSWDFLCMYTPNSLIDLLVGVNYNFRPSYGFGPVVEIGPDMRSTLIVSPTDITAFHTNTLSKILLHICETQTHWTKLLEHFNINRIGNNSYDVRNMLLILIRCTCTEHFSKSFSNVKLQTVNVFDVHLIRTRYSF